METDEPFWCLADSFRVSRSHACRVWAFTGFVCEWMPNLSLMNIEVMIACCVFPHLICKIYRRFVFLCEIVLHVYFVP